MPQEFRKDWSRHVDQVIRSRHYTWLGEGLGGDPIDEAVSTMTADLMHICKRQGIAWEDVAQKAQDKYEHEEAACASA